MEMIIKNRKILLTVFNRGRLGTPVSNSSDKSIKAKILRSPFENHIINSKGVPTGKYNTPKNHFKAPNDFKERKETICSCKTTLSEQVTNYFISSESCPFSIDKKKWSKMKEQERLEVHLKLNAEGKEFAYELI